MGTVKTTLEIQDTLMLRAKRLSKQTGRPLRALVEEGLRLVLAGSERRGAYQLPDLSVGTAGGPNPLEGYSWQALRDEIYSTPTPRGTGQG